MVVQALQVFVEDDSDREDVAALAFDEIGVLCH